MFAILLHKSMDPFYQNISSFPTAVFTFTLAVCVLFWLLAFFGLFDLDFLDLDIDGIETDIDLGSDVSGANALAGLLLKFGLYGVPVTITISFISLFSWLISYYCVHYLGPWVPDGLIYFIFGLLVIFVAFWLAVILTGLILKIIRPFFQNTKQQTIKQLVGQFAIVRTSKVTDRFGEAYLNNEGAELILKVRSMDKQTYSKGDKVILMEYQADDNSFLVLSEHEFYDSTKKIFSKQ